VSFQFKLLETFTLRDMQKVDN